MNYLIHGGINPGVNATIHELLTRKYFVGDNVGNLLFINAVAQSIGVGTDDSFSCTHYRNSFSPKEIERINAEYDAYILPLADAFREENQLKQRTETIRKLKIPCHVIGVGLRAPYDADSNTAFPFDDDVKRFIAAILEKSACIGVRGSATGRYLSRLGFREDRDYMVIGCPSMCMAAAGRGLRIRSLNTIETLSVNANDLAPQNVNEMIKRAIAEHPDSYVIQQRESEMADVYLGPFSDYRSRAFRTPGTLYGAELYHRLVRENRIRYFSNIYRWIEFAAKTDFCLNSRFHGSVVSMMAGTPTIIVPIDSRMQEMVEYHAIPAIPAAAVRASDSIEALVEKMDLHSAEKVAARNLERYFTFLDRNGLSHVQSSFIPGYCRLDGGAGGMEWRAPEKAYVELSGAARIGRVSRYYIDKSMNKVINKLRKV